ncbi:hypothetical protein [Polluticoccus soli]|uniref:hypothetical protein n=1 Tax=Polluticoccus soli TaxID=3034150 RepID=UPI0023E0DFB3|nr:hypothetical protein [Flavipsychrobacter sp. JY13-12]
MGSDERGYTAEYLHDRSGQQLILFRKAGSVSGRHYHKGISAAKSPEILVLLQGKLRLNWKAVGAAEMQTTVVEGPAKLQVPPLVWHELIAETDCVLLEMNSIAEHAADTFELPKF